MHGGEAILSGAANGVGNDADGGESICIVTVPTIQTIAHAKRLDANVSMRTP